MDLNWLLFSPEGRLNRKPYWIVSWVLGGINTVLYVATLQFDISMLLLSSCSLLVFLLSLMPVIKRLHYRNKSAWCLLLLLVPFVNIWIAIELGFFKGTEGENRFGADPLAEQISNIEQYRGR